MKDNGFVLILVPIHKISFEKSFQPLEYFLASEQKTRDLLAFEWLHFFQEDEKSKVIKCRYRNCYTMHTKALWVLLIKTKLS